MNAEQAAQRYVLIRPATSADLPAVEDVARRTWRESYRGQIAEDAIEQFLSENYSVSVLERVLESPAATLLVAASIDSVVGYVTAGHDNGEIFAIYVLPDWQGEGVGRRLWQAAMAVLGDFGHATCHLWVLEENTSARGFYERQGGKAAVGREFAVGEAVIKEVRYDFALLD